MARSLIAWGWGHLSLGDGRGAVVLGLEIVWLVAILAALPLLQTDRWILVFGLISGFLFAWVVQAAAAQRVAVRRSGRSSGATLLVALLPVAIVVETAFWLLGGSTAAPSATLARYVNAWETHHPENATALFVAPTDVPSLTASFESDDRSVLASVESAAASNPSFDLDETNPYTNLRFVYHDASEADRADRVAVDIQIVRLATVPTTFFGFFPATRSETQAVATIGQVIVLRRPATTPPILAASVWLIDSITVGR